LCDNKLATVAEMYCLGWEWRRRLFAWEEELMWEFVDFLSNVVLQVGVVDHWV